MSEAVDQMSGRADGRPEAFDIAKGAHTSCDQCFLDNQGQRKLLPYGDVVIVSPVDSPYADSIAHHFCIGHLKALLPNVVIVDPNDRFLCRNLDGLTWKEG